MLCTKTDIMLVYGTDKKNERNEKNTDWLFASYGQYWYKNMEIAVEIYITYNHLQKLVIKNCSALKAPVFMQIFENSEVCIVKWTLNTVRIK